jgi:hypothetical protein
MPRIPIFRLGQSSVAVDPPRLSSYIPTLSLEGLQVGIDNLRFDVHLSPRFIEVARVQLGRLIAHHGEVGHMLAAEAPTPAYNRSFNWNSASTKQAPKADPSDLKTVLVELQVAALNRAKAEGNPSIDLLARLAVIKFVRTELQTQFAALLERCRIMLKGLEGVRQQRALEYREQVAAFQVRKKIILRKVGQELFLTLREIEKETLARTRRSYFGDANDNIYKLFLNRLIFTEDGRDDYISAEHYVMFGNFDKDIDRFSNVRAVVMEYLRSCTMAESGEDDAVVDGWLNVPENAQELLASGTPDESRPEGRVQKERLAAWVALLSEQGLMDHVIASYEAVPLLAEYAPRINAQQLKNALVSRAECDRVEKLIEQHGKLTADSLYAAVGRTVSCRGAERSKIAGRYLYDFIKYHRDYRCLEVLNSALDSVNLIGNDKLLELSKVNGTLYEFLLGEEQKPGSEKVRDHVIVKADVRDSTRLTRTLVERGLNPASFFSLNFYDPVNKLLPKYSASKVFIEGDAIILAILGREGETSLAVSRACVLAREMVEIVRGYNELLARSGLPSIELGLGISYVQAAPLFLMDGEQRIMISDAINESDRLSSCNKRARQVMEKLETPFRVYAFQTVSDADAAGSAEDFAIAYNLGGVRINEAAFGKLKQEISLELCRIELPALWTNEPYHLYRGLVPIGNDIFRKVVVRESKVALIDPRTFTLVKWGDRSYYEVCTSPEVYSLLEAGKAVTASR